MKRHGSLTDGVIGQCCGSCIHYEFGPKKMKAGGFRLGRCLYNKPLLYNGRFNQFEDNGGNCSCYSPNAEVCGSRNEVRTEDLL